MLLKRSCFSPVRFEAKGWLRPFIDIGQLLHHYTARTPPLDDHLRKIGEVSVEVAIGGESLQRLFVYAVG